MERALETPERAALLCQCFNIRFKIGDTAVFNVNSIRAESVDRKIISRARVVDGIPSVQVDVAGETVLLPIDQVIAKVEFRDRDDTLPSPQATVPENALSSDNNRAASGVAIDHAIGEPSVSLKSAIDGLQEIARMISAELDRPGDNVQRFRALQRAESAARATLIALGAA